MNSPDPKARELRHKKQQLRKRQQEIQLSELAAEIDRSVPAYITRKYDEQANSQTNSKLQQWRRKIAATTQFTGIIIAVVITVRIASWLATALIVGGIALIAYQTLFEED